MIQRRLAAASGVRGSGFTLLELMIGIAIGLVTTLIVANVLLLAEAQPRSISAGSDAQVNGALSLYTIQRDVQMAGYGVAASPDGLGCEIRAHRNGTGFTWTLAPVLITNGTNGAPDAITVLSSATDRYAAPLRVIADHPNAASSFLVNTTMGVGEGDLMVAVPPAVDAGNWCSVFNVTALGNNGVLGQPQNQLHHGTGEAGPWNQSGGGSIFPAAGYPAGSYLLNLGRLINRTYSVTANGALRLTSFNTAAGSNEAREIFTGIVNLQAYYGLDSDDDGAIDSYTAVTPTSNDGWRRLVTVRIAVVARSAQFEKEDVTHADPVWDVGTAVAVDGAADCGTSKCVALKVGHVGDWKRYRYRVYDVVVPLRNMLWHS
jgi:type IV pilus assembly protein PilW